MCHGNDGRLRFEFGIRDAIMIDGFETFDEGEFGL